MFPPKIKGILKPGLRRKESELRMREEGKKKKGSIGSIS
jgi:hypothetical protein